MNYRDKNTGEVYSIEELREIWRQFGAEDRHDTFEDMLDDLEKTEDDPT